MQFRQRQPLNLSVFNSTAGDTPKSHNKAPAIRNYSTKGFEASMNEVDLVLQRERKVMKENQQKAQTTLDREKKHRIELESKLLQAKEQVSRRDRDLAEVRYKLESMLQQNRNIALENDHLRRDMDSAREAYEYKMQELQARVSEGETNYRNAAERYTEQYQTFRQEGQDYIDILTFQHERQRKSLEDSVRRLEQRNSDLTAEAKRLNDQLADQQLSYEEQIRSNINRVRDEQQRKYNASLLGLEQKLRTSEGIRDSLSKKNQQLLRQIQDKENSLSCVGIDRTEQCASLRQEVTSLKDRVTQLKLALERANSQLADKDQQLSRKACSSESEALQLRQKVDQYKKQVEQLTDTIRSVKQQARQAAVASERRQQQLLERCSYHESECQRYRNESVNTWQHLKSKLSQTIESIHH